MMDMIFLKRLAIGLGILFQSGAAQTLCYLSPVNGFWQVVQRNLDGTGRKVLTSTAFDKKDPVFHPDGKRVFYSGINHGLYSVDISTGAEIEAKGAMTGTRGLKFSQRGDRVLYYRARTDANDQSEIWIADSAFKNPVQVVSRPGLQRYPDGNADFSVIVYLSGRSTTGHDLWIYRTREDKHFRITNDMTTEGPPALSPTGESAVFPSAPLASYGLYLTSIQDPLPEPILHTETSILEVTWLNSENLLCTFMVPNAEPQLAKVDLKAKSFLKLAWEEAHGIRSPSIRRP